MQANTFHLPASPPPNMKPAATLLALALALCLGNALANDLQITVKVYGCKGK